MPATLQVESTLIDRYQTTVPETARRALRLGKRDKIHYTIHPDGEVVLTRAAAAGGRRMSGGRPLVVDGWTLYAHPIFLDQLDALMTPVEGLGAQGSGRLHQEERHQAPGGRRQAGVRGDPAGLHPTGVPPGQ